MLTTNSLQRSISKWKYAVLLILIISAIVLALSFSINRYLPQYALALRDLIDQQLSVNISFSSINYRFPSYIVVKDIKVFESGQKNALLEASRMIIGLTLPISSVGPSLHYVEFNDAAIDFTVLKNYWKQHGYALSIWFQALPKGNLRLLVTNGQFYLKDKTHDPFPFKIDVSLNHNEVAARGSWKDKDKFNFELYGDILAKGFNLSKLDIEGSQSSVNLWGEWQGNTVDWKGFVLYKNSYILDINGHLDIQDAAIVLKGLSFSVNGDDVTLSGRCSKEQLFQCDADMALSRQQQHLSASTPLKNMNVHLHAQHTPQGIIFNGQTDMNFLFDMNSPFVLQSTHLDFKNLKARILNAELLQLKIDQLQASWVSLEEHELSAKNILASVHWPQPSHEIITLSARIYNGHYRSRIFLDTTAMPWQIKEQVKINAIDINRLGSTFSIFRQCHGLLSGNFDLQSLKNMQLSGALMVKNGDFHDPDLLPWVAKTLQMPALDPLTGVYLSCHFKIDGNSKMLEDLKLHADGVSLNGSFDIDTEDMVSSRMAVRFSKELLSSSPMGRSIIGMVQQAWTLPFEFRLSGNIYRMNFQWDHSPLKNKVRQHMFAFVERMIDRRMNANPPAITQNPGL